MLSNSGSLQFLLWAVECLQLINKHKDVSGVHHRPTAQYCWEIILLNAWSRCEQYLQADDHGQQIFQSSSDLPDIFCGYAMKANSILITDLSTRGVLLYRTGAGSFLPWPSLCIGKVYQLYSPPCDQLQVRAVMLKQLQLLMRGGGSQSTQNPTEVSDQLKHWQPASLLAC